MDVLKSGDYDLPTAQRKRCVDFVKLFEKLRQIADKLESGQIILRQGQEELILQLPVNLILEVQVEDEDKKSKGIQHSLELEIKWFDDIIVDSQPHQVRQQKT